MSVDKYVIFVLLVISENLNCLTTSRIMLSKNQNFLVINSLMFRQQGKPGFVTNKCSEGNWDK